jgi:hypothetical protein
VASLTIAFSTTGTIPQSALNFASSITANAETSGSYNGINWRYEANRLTIFGGYGSLRLC